VPLLSRLVGIPLAVEIRPRAVASLSPLLVDRHISSGGDVAVVVGNGQGSKIAADVSVHLDRAKVITVEAGTLEAAQKVAEELRLGFFDAVVGIGGGRLLDTAKWAATHTGLPMVAVATNLAHDGIASPVASLDQSGRRASFGVQMPSVIIVDLDYVRASPVRMRRSGIGDVVSNVAALADWELAAEQRGEVIDGVAVTLARTAALVVMGREDGVNDDAFLTVLAEGLILSGLAMSVAGSSRPCSGGDHEIVHAVDHLFPGTSNHGELAGLGALFTSFLRDNAEMAVAISRCLRQHGLPRTPEELGLSDDQFATAVSYAPNTRPDRYTILEHLALDDLRIAEAVSAFTAWVEHETS
jgi:glycerol-1-phosphate dehydrogenase [NAD(P)+]